MTDTKLTAVVHAPSGSPSQAGIVFLDGVVATVGLPETTENSMNPTWEQVMAWACFYLLLPVNKDLFAILEERMVEGRGYSELIGEAFVPSEQKHTLN